MIGWQCTSVGRSRLRIALCEILVDFLDSTVARKTWAALFLTLTPLTLIAELVAPSYAQAPSPPNLSILPAWASTERDDLLQAEGDIYRVYYDTHARLSALAVDHDIWEVNPKDRYATMALDAKSAAHLIAQGYRVEPDTKRVGIRPLGPPGYPCYRDVNQLYAALNQFSTDYPDLAELIDYGDSWCKENPGTCIGNEEGYDLWVLQITNSQIEVPKPRFFLMANLHARELTTAEAAVYFAEYLLDNYGTDPDVTWIVDYHEIYVVVTVNPDGRQLVEGDCLQRKNRNDSQGDCTLCDTMGADQYGVDLNRNYPYQWGGGSTDACSDMYQGPSAASEPETYHLVDLVRSLFRDQRADDDISPAPGDATGLLFSLHSYGNLVLWPWSYKTQSAPNSSQLQTLGRKFAYFNSYRPQQSSELYLTRGGTGDWAYGELGIAAYTFELGEEYFQPCGDLPQIVGENMGALLYAAKVPRTPYLTPGGPDSLDLTVAPITATVGETAQLTATLNDNRYNNSSGTEPTQNIASAEYYIDTPPWITTTTSISYPMTARDGSFDEKIEVVTATVDTTELSGGRHTLFVRGRDADGNWGAFSAAFLWVDQPITLTTITVTPTLVTVTVGVAQTFTATGYDQYGDPMPITPTWMTDGGTVNPTSGMTTVLTAQTVPISRRLITATQGSVSDTVEFQIVHGDAAAIKLAPTATTTAAGESSTYTVTARDAYSNSWDVTALSLYSVTLAAGGTWMGNVYTSEVAGIWIITASCLDLTDTAVLTVTHAPTATGTTLSPAQHTARAGEQVVYTLIASDTYGNSWDATPEANCAVSPAAGGTWTDNVYSAEIAGTWAVAATYLSLIESAVLTITHVPTAVSAILTPSPYKVAAGWQVVYTLVATDAYGNSWDASVSGVYTVTPAAGGSWTDNVYTSQYTGTWVITATVPHAVASAILTVTEEPVAHFARVPDGVTCIGTAVQFTDTSSGDPSAWAWAFGDGDIADVQHPTHTYTATGTFTVTLTVTNPFGSDGATDAVPVISGPSATIVRTPAGEVCAGGDVGFSAINGGGPAGYLWSFGDGITATGQHNSHIYASGGTYTVWLTATNGCDTDVVSTTVTVAPGPSASFVRYPVGDVPVSTTVHFTDTSGGEPMAWLWEFGDGSTSTLQHPEHVYTSVGVFAITLTVTQTCGSDTVTGTVIVRSGDTGVVILALISDSPVNRAQTMHFTVTVSGTMPITYNWVFGDGTLPTTSIGLVTVSHVYTSSGLYTMHLTTTNCCGSDSTSLTVTVNTVQELRPLYIPLVIRHHTSHPPPSSVLADQ